MQVFASRERDEQILGETYHVLKSDENSFNGMDIVLFAGKGHETYQLIDGKKLPFSERALIAAAAERITVSK